MLYHFGCNLDVLRAQAEHDTLLHGQKDRSGAGAKFIAMTPELMKKGAEIGMKYSAKIADEMKAGQTPPDAK